MNANYVESQSHKFIYSLQVFYMQKVVQHPHGINAYPKLEDCFAVSNTCQTVIIHFHMTKQRNIKILLCRLYGDGRHATLYT